MTHTPAAALLPPAAAHAAEAERLAERLEHSGPHVQHVQLGEGFAALAHGLLAIAAAIQAAGTDTSDALTSMAADADDISGCLDSTYTALRDGLAGIDDSLVEVACEIAGTRTGRRRWPWPRRRLVAGPLPEDSGGLPKVCDNTSAGVIVGDGTGRFLMFDRATFPPGTAPAAGHVDGHGGFEAAARAEVAEELGLTVTRLRQVTGGWRDNVCRRAPGHLGTGHKWAVYQATAGGELRPSARETRNARWLTAAQLQDLAARTASYAHGLLTAAEFDASPGIEPVWAQWLADAGIIRVPPADLAAIDRLAAGKPAALAGPGGES